MYYSDAVVNVVTFLSLYYFMVAFVLNWVFINCVTLINGVNNIHVKNLLTPLLITVCSSHNSNLMQNFGFIFKYTYQLFLCVFLCLSSQSLILLAVDNYVLIYNTIHMFSFYNCRMLIKLISCAIIHELHSLSCSKLHSRLLNYLVLHDLQTNYSIHIYINKSECVSLCSQIFWPKNLKWHWLWHDIYSLNFVLLIF